MRENVLRAGWLADLDSEQTPNPEPSFQPADPQPERGWNPEDFAREQIVGLVRRVFLQNLPASPGSSSEKPIRQVVFTTIDRGTDLHGICQSVGDALAREIEGTVGILARDVRSVIDPELRRGPRSEHAPGMPLRRIGTRVRGNFWLVPPLGGEGAVTASSLHAYLGEMRREFDYSIIESPPAGESHQTTAMAQFGDGVILVLSAHQTRWVTARKIKDMLEAAQVRILGTVLSDRMFPIPDKLYRRL